MNQICVVTSGKGGAGKSTVTAGLGYALSRHNERVLLIDADAGLRSLDLMLGVSGNTMYDLSDVLSSNCDPARAIYSSPVFASNKAKEHFFQKPFYYDKIHLAQSLSF